MLQRLFLMTPAAIIQRLKLVLTNIGFRENAINSVGQNYPKMPCVNKTWARPGLCSYNEDVIHVGFMCPTFAWPWWRHKGSTKDPAQKHVVHDSKPGGDRQCALQPSLLPVFTNNALLRHQQTHLSMNCLWLFLYCNGRLEWLWQRLHGPQLNFSF